MSIDNSIDERDLHDFYGVVVSSLSIVGEEWFDSPAPYYERIPEFLHSVILEMAAEGISGRAISRELGYHKNQIRRVLKKYPEVDRACCLCGRSRKHQGWCKIRFANSPARQEFIS